MFEEFGKIARLSRNCVVTEKIDGTNAQVYIPEDGSPMLIGSRTRWITPSDDNFGFARWAMEHEEELRNGLGPGRHFGEWYGQKIQRTYGLDHKRFALFNTGRWVQGYVGGSTRAPLGEKQEYAPECCYVVPVLYEGTFDTARIEATVTLLKATGSKAVPGYMNPEGVVVWHEAARQLFKKTVEKDEAPKSQGRIGNV